MAYDLVENSQNISATTTFVTSKGAVDGIFVSSASSTPTIKVWDSKSAAGTVLVNTFTPVAATWYQFGSFLAAYGTGLTVSIGGTVSCTVFYVPMDRNDS